MVPLAATLIPAQLTTLLGQFPLPAPHFLENRDAFWHPFPSLISASFNSFSSLHARPPAGKAAKEAGSSSPENAFIRGSITLHDKYMEYVQVRYSGGTGGRW